MQRWIRLVHFVRPQPWVGLRNASVSASLMRRRVGGAGCFFCFPIGAPCPRGSHRRIQVTGDARGENPGAQYLREGVGGRFGALWAGGGTLLGAKPGGGEETVQEGTVEQVHHGGSRRRRRQSHAPGEIAESLAFRESRSLFILPKARRAYGKEGLGRRGERHALRFCPTASMARWEGPRTTGK